MIPVSDNDNANSTVLILRYGDCSVLLPGDLEGLGAKQLMNSPPQAVDLAMAPHHGSLSDHTDSFLRWCEPRFLVVSGKSNPLARRSDLLRKDCRVLHTELDGAVTAVLHTDRIDIHTFHDRVD